MAGEIALALVCIVIFFLVVGVLYDRGIGSGR